MKEVERYRLSKGLKNLERQAPNLSNLQTFTRALSIPGITPQGIEGLSRLTTQQERGKALAQQQGLQNQPKPNPFPEQNSRLAPKENVSPSLTNEKTFEKAQEGYIPKTQEEITNEAGQMFNANRALYNNDPQLALDAAKESDARNQAIAQAHQTQHANLSKLQEGVVSGLKHQSQLLNTKVPANVYSKIEDEAIQATKPRKDGGEGLTEQAAKKKFGEKLDLVSRDYQDLENIGNWGIVGNKSKNTLGTLKSLQKSFAGRNDTQNMADNLIANSKLSPKVAYSIAQPVSQAPELNKALKELPEIQKNSILPPNVLDPEAFGRTMEVAPELAKYLTGPNGDKVSPLAVGYELEKKGYDPSAWIEYLRANVDSLNLRQNQVGQLQKQENLFGTFNDWWLDSFSGLE